MTEEDTFKALQRSPYSVVCEEYYMTYIRRAISSVYSGAPEPKVLVKHGWTRAEFARAVEREENGYNTY